MAIWQFQLVVIPKKGILEKFGHVPEKLQIDYKEREEYYYLKEENLIEEEDKFTDALIQDWWSSTEIQPMEIIHQIDKNVRRSDFGRDSSVNWKFYSSKVDNDASMSINKETGKIENIRFRADLREENFKFLRAMIGLADKYEWLLMDMQGNLANPDMKQIGRLIKSSNSYKFLKDPIAFLTDIGDGKLEIE
ncbi:hypothetical protein H9S92_01560 [Lewinella lacunae]|uniref:Uncharacterized protein n=2 Tax=Neolewinella lacunae TaxID=1517758 RepID=A0A923PEZ3_9BACT|nr:hypothetical protein [Neolewinella lacunae]MBC6992837.1 hypothetical protein [Neolewinella lacunae]